MNKVYVLMVERWSGSYCQTEVVEVFKDKELADSVSSQNQGITPSWEVMYYVVDVLFNEFEP